jgi:hypothetical protein
LYSVDLPCIWWCATGPLAFLPIHVAGIYDSRTAGVNISDYVVSTFTLTLTALINAAKNHQMHGKFRSLLAVTQPNTPGQSLLPNTSVELAEIKRQACNFGIYVLEGHEAITADHGEYKITAYVSRRI